MDVNKVTLQYLVNPNLLNKIYGEDNNKIYVLCQSPTRF